MTSTRQPIVAGNWKMNKTTTEASAFTRTLWQHLSTEPTADLPDIVLCPSFTSLDVVQKVINDIQASFIVAAQNMASENEGAYTGEISPLMLLDLDIRWVVLGHSERRQLYHETDEAVAAKTIAALTHDITPIVCVGETLEQREAGETDSVITRQVSAVTQRIEARDLPRLVFAYEPVWAIGTGKVCEADEANRVCGLIRGLLVDGSQTRILYGGSVKPDNMQSLINQPEIDGGLVGGASLQPESFASLIRQACPVNA